MLSAAGTTTESPRTRINYRGWLLRVVVWDGVIAILLMLAPLVLQQALKKDGQNDEDELVAIFAVFIPIGAFLLRWFIGARHLDKNRCSVNFRQFQTFCFFGGLISMLFGDCLVLGLHDMLPRDQMLVPLVMLTPFYSVYLLGMIIAMYPGREPIPKEELTQIGNWQINR